MNGEVRTLDGHGQVKIREGVVSPQVRITAQSIRRALSLHCRTTFEGKARVRRDAA